MDAFEPAEYPDETPTERESDEFRSFCARMSSGAREQLRTGVRFAVETAAHNRGPLELFSDVGGIGDAGVQTY